MFHRVQQYELINVDGRWYRPRAYADPQPVGVWDGWLVFFPLNGGAAIAPPDPETNQRAVRRSDTPCPAPTPAARSHTETLPICL
jgi:hypothetical protein